MITPCRRRFSPSFSPLAAFDIAAADAAADA
jgi:hypothetical protein